MGVFEKVIGLREAKTPITAYWTIAGVSLPGTLEWEGSTPVLRVLAEMREDQVRPGDDPDLEVLHRTKPPEQPIAKGWNGEAGAITLVHCFRTDVRTRWSGVVGQMQCEITFRPSQVWVGSTFYDENQPLRTVRLVDRRLGGFFGSAEARSHFRGDDEASELYERFGDPDIIWTLRGRHLTKVDLHGTDLELGIGSSIHETHSHSQGQGAYSATNLYLEPTSAVTVGAARSTVFELRKMLSLFALDRFTFEVEEYEYDDGMISSSCAPVWELGEDRAHFRPPMQHEILVRFEDDAMMQTLCREWFGAPETTRLSRWLFDRSLAEREDGLGRFVTVCQAFEVLGRENAAAPHMTRAELRKATKAVRAALHEFDDDFVERAAQLIGSSNRESFRDVLVRLLTEALDHATPGWDGDLTAFCGEVSRTRNAVVHMTDRKEGELNAAFGLVNKLGRRLSFLYALVQAAHMGLPLNDVDQFMFNNRLARHGLPNEVLDAAREWGRSDAA